MAPSAGPACQAPWPALLDVAVGKTMVGPIPTKSPVFFLSSHGRTAISNIGKSPNSVRVPPRELGIVTSAHVGRCDCVSGSYVLGGMRGINGRRMNWLVSSSLTHAECVQGP